MNNAISRDIPGNCKRPISQVVDTECINIGIDLPPSPKYSKYTLFFCNVQRAAKKSTLQLGRNPVLFFMFILNIGIEIDNSFNQSAGDLEYTPGTPLPT